AGGASRRQGDALPGAGGPTGDRYPRAASPATLFPPTSFGIVEPVFRERVRAGWPGGAVFRACGRGVVRVLLGAVQGNSAGTRGANALAGALTGHPCSGRRPPNQMLQQTGAADGHSGYNVPSAAPAAERDRSADEACTMISDQPVVICATCGNS